MILTVIEDAFTSNKKIVSKNNDNTFNFINVDIDLENIHNAFHNYFILSRPLSKSMRNIRDSSLESFYKIDAGYVVVDFDKVQSNKTDIINYFKNNNYTINLFNSRNNLKAVIEVDFLTTRSNVEAFLTMLDEHLVNLCEIDVSSARNASYQAPTKKSNYLLLNKGHKPTLEDIKQYISEHKPIQEYKDIDTMWFWNKFISDYGMIPKEYYNQNGTIQCSLPIEEKTKFSYYWSKNIPWLLQHPNKNKTINIFEDFIKSEEGKKYIKNKRLEFFKDKFKINSNLKVKNKFFEIDNSTIDIIDKSLNDKNSVLVIKGIMGSGKSNIIEYINKPKILFISVRRTLSYDIKQKYKCKHYLDDMNTKNKNCYRPGDSLVVQIDSLHKINHKFFDYVVIDEFESFCLYTQNNMLNSCDYYMKNMYIIKELFKKNLIIADAFINSFSLDLYFSDRKKYIIENTYKDDANVYVYEHKHTFISMLEQICINKKEKEIISCSFGTLNEMSAVKKILEKNNLKVLYLDSNTPDDAKELASSLFKNKDIDIYDVILFSPTITVGISILNNVTHHFHYDTGKSIDTISSVQMTKRSRLAKYIHIYLAGNKKNKIYDTNVLDNDLLKSINNVSNSELFNYDTNELSNIGKFINKFTAHTNFYVGNNKSIIEFLLSQQFQQISNIDEKLNNSLFDKICKKENKKRKMLYKTLDLQDIDINYKKKNLSDDDRLYQEALELKDSLFYLDDKSIIDIINYNKNIKNKIKNLLFYIKTKEQKEFQLKKIILNSLKNIIVDQEYLNDLKLLAKYDFKLLEFYTKSELQNNLLLNEDFNKILNIIGYKKRNGGYYLPKIFKNILSQSSI